MRVMCYNLHKSWQRPEEGSEREVVTIPAQVDGGGGELGHEGVGGGDEVVQQLLVLLAGRGGIEAAHYVLFELRALG